MLRSITLLSLSLIALAACSTSAAEEGVDTAAQTAPLCTAGAAFHGPSFDDDLGIVASARGTRVNVTSSATIGTGLHADPRTNPVTVLAVGTGALAGNFAQVDPVDWQLCGGALVVAPSAHVVFGDGLTHEQLRGCAADLSRPECYVLAHYCALETLMVWTDRAPRCLLNPNVPISVTVRGGAACVPGDRVARPGFDDDLERISVARTKHDASGYALSRVVPAGADVLTNVFAYGSGEHEGNFQYLALNQWKVCGSELHVQPRAEIELLGGGLTEAQLAGCAKDLGGSECETIAHYCEPGTLYLPVERAPRCSLREGIEVRATFSRKITP